VLILLLLLVALAPLADWLGHKFIFMVADRFPYLQEIPTLLTQYLPSSVNVYLPVAIPYITVRITEAVSEVILVLLFLLLLFLGRWLGGHALLASIILFVLSRGIAFAVAAYKLYG
jgi:hypothetical protein